MTPCNVTDYIDHKHPEFANDIIKAHAKLIVLTSFKD